MKLLICNSNMFVPIVMTEVLLNKDKQYVVGTDQENIRLFFNKMSIPNVKLWVYSVPFPKLNDYFKDTRRIKREFAELEIDSIDFYHTEYGNFANYIISKSRVPCRNGSPYEPIKGVPVSYSFRNILKRIRLCLLYRVPINLITDGTRLIPSLSERFYSKNSILKFIPNIDYNLISNYINSILKFDFENVLLTGSTVANGILPEDKYVEITNQIIKSVGSDNIVSKCHPRFTDVLGLEKHLKQIPSYIPTNVIMNCFKMVIGFNSTTLCEVASLGIKSISTIYLFDIEKEKQDYYHDYLLMKCNGKGSILFPKTLDELSEMILF